MIQYEAIQNNYKYNMDELNRLISMAENISFKGKQFRTQENISEFLKNIDGFINNMEVTEEKIVLERHETEEEARAYFGEEFIETFDNLLTRLDREETIVGIHGTSEAVCPLICENGLQYKSPSVDATMVKQEMSYGQKEMKYGDYEGLLNWGHKNYKGLVIVAIPYECFYKEGLWNKYQDTDTFAYGGQDYRIDPDFIVGYIDVNNKKIVLNPKYNRQHNYSGYVKDYEIFREIPGINNSQLKEMIIAQNKMFETEEDYYRPSRTTEEVIDPQRIIGLTEDLIGAFNAVKLGSPNEMTEKRFKYLLEQISYNVEYLRKAIPLLKTIEQVQKEEEELEKKFSAAENSGGFDDDDFDWGDDIEWDEPEESQSHKFY